jgi:hypothetical protein
MTINLSDLGADLKTWLYQAEDQIDTKALQRQVEAACSQKPYSDLTQAIKALDDLSGAFKAAGFDGTSELVELVDRQRTVLGGSAKPTEEDVSDEVVADVERQIVQIQREWANSQAEADEERDPEVRSVKKRSLEESEDSQRAMLMDAYDVLNTLKRQKTAEEAPAAKPAEAPAEQTLKTPDAKPAEPVAQAGDAASAAPQAALEPKAQ